MGWVQHGRSREASASECTAWLLQPTFCSSLRIMHSFVQLLNHLLLPHQLNQDLCGSLWPARCSGERQVQPQNEATGHAFSVEKRVPVVPNRPCPCHWDSIWPTILPLVQQILQEWMLWWWTLLANFC